MKISPMTPRFLQETILNICIIIGAIVGTVGLVCFIISGFSGIDAAVCHLLGGLIVFAFIKIKSLHKDFSDDGPKDGSEE